MNIPLEEFKCEIGDPKYREQILAKHKSEIAYIISMHRAQRNSYCALSGTFRLLRSCLPDNEWAGYKRVFFANYDFDKMEYKNDAWEFDTDNLTRDVSDKDSKLFSCGKADSSVEGLKNNYVQLGKLANHLDSFNLKIKNLGNSQRAMLQSLQKEAKRMDVEVRWTVERTFQNVFHLANDEQFYEVRNPEFDLHQYLNFYLEAQDYLRTKSNVRFINNETAPLCNALLCYAKEHEHEEISWKQAAHYFQLRYDLFKPNHNYRKIADAYGILASQTNMLAQEILGRDGLFLRNFIGEVDIYMKTPFYIEEIYAYCVFRRNRMPKC